MGYLDAQEGAQSRTAFRTAEKLYKRYKHSSTQLKGSKSRSKKVPPIDTSGVLDFSKYADVLRDRSSKVDGVSLATGGPFDSPVFVIDGHPGFYFIPQALSTEEQFLWIQKSLTSFVQPPNRTNHNAVYGPVSELWSNVQDQCVLIEGSATDLDASENLRGRHCDQPNNQLCETINSLNFAEAKTSCLQETITSEDETGLSSIEPVTTQTSLAHKAPAARVISERVDEVGRSWHFVDASKVRSSSSTTKSSQPVPAKSLLRKLRWATIGLQFDWSKKAYNTMLSHKELSPELSELAARLAKPAMNGEKFVAEAAIVNYYGPDDMLGGHVDDMEADWSKPIVSISLGCKAVFLLGGTSRQDAPVAMFLRSGDVVLMAGPARQCFHGVPRIFVEPNASDLPDFSAFDEVSGSPFLDYIRESRINVNVRQVH